MEPGGRGEGALTSGTFLSNQANFAYEIEAVKKQDSTLYIRSI